MNEAELTVVGITCCLVGVFFLANSIIFRKLRNVIAVFFNARMRSLNTIKDYTLNNLQVALGFVFLAFGFLLQMYAKLAGVEAGRHATVWLTSGSIVVFAVVVYMGGKSYSRHTFKKYLRRFFQDHPEAFNKDIIITKEIGEFLGVRHTQEMTVEDYLQRVREALRMTTVETSHLGEGLVPKGGRRRHDLSALHR